MESAAEVAGGRTELVEVRAECASITTRSNRTQVYRVTTRAERAKSVALRLEVGSSGAVYSHRYRNKVGFALVFFVGGQRKPVRFGRAARFTLVEGEVQNSKAEYFWREGF